ncbi:hypothetical protein ACFXB4_40790 [Streptomyces lavendulae]|uniref:hypothetical protein n=1 Tax=Streptomyces lavendulae TaxID=1914 RepID=UPI0036C48F2B
MSETTPTAKGPAPVQISTDKPQLALTPASEFKPEDIAVLDLEYTDGKPVPVLVLKSGEAIPSRLVVVDSNGQPRFAYGLSEVLEPGADIGGFDELVCSTVQTAVVGYHHKSVSYVVRRR